MLGKHLVDKYPGKELALKMPPVVEALRYVTEKIDENLSISVTRNAAISFFRKINSNENISSLKADDNGKIDISSILDKEDIRNIMMLDRSAFSLYSFNERKARIKSRIAHMKNTSSRYYIGLHNTVNFLKTIPRDDLNNFFSKLEDLLIRQLTQEDLFLQGKTSSLGMIDNLKDGKKSVFKNSLNVPRIAIKYPGDAYGELLHKMKLKSFDDMFSIFQSFDDLIDTKFYDIINYLIFFQDEKDQFFKNNDLNSMKNSIVKILNFLSSKSSKSQQSASSIINDIISLANNIKISYNGKLSTPYEIIANEFKDKDLGSKREYLEKTNNAFQLIHNYESHREIESIVRSNTFKKSYMQNIFELQNLVIPMIADSFIGNKFDQIMQYNKNIIAEEYLTDNVINFFKYATYVNSPEKYDELMTSLIGDGSSESIRKVKFVLSFVKNYSDLKKWIHGAKPKVSGVFAPNLNTEKFRFRVLKDYDPYHFAVGTDTDCCQSIGGAGESAAIDSFINPYAGVLLLEAKNGSSWGLAAQSYFHYVEDDEMKAIILDNIEAGKYKDMYENDFSRKAYATLAKFLMKKEFTNVGCGKDYTEVIDENDFEIGSIDSDNRHFEISEHGEEIYSDFDKKSFFDLTKPKFEVGDVSAMEGTGELSAMSSSILGLYIMKYGSIFSKKILKVSNFLDTNGFKKEARDVVSLAVMKA
jgi:hypothetical protein